MARLRELGCRIAMNGYLTEGMSISLLNAVDIVKLGAEVCSGIADRSSDVGLLKAAIEFAHRAGVKVVAECVENERDVGWRAHYRFARAQIRQLEDDPQGLGLG